MHPNTRLTFHSRRWMIEQYLQGVPVKVLVEQHYISRTTFYRWRKRYREEGYCRLENHSSRPRQIQYRLTPADVSRAC